MATAITLIADPKHDALTPALLTDIKKRLAPAINGGITVRKLAEGEALDLFCDVRDPKLLRIELRMCIAGKPIDFAIQTHALRKKKLLISDMDSTIIQQECIDETAALLGLKEKVAAITEQAMNGELDFREALAERVALLKGISTADLQRVYDEHITLTPGARTLVQTMNANGAATVLVSGGFTFFTRLVANATGFKEDHANRFDIENDTLTGLVLEPILDKDAKVSTLYDMLEKYNIQQSESIAVGDGANDIPMLKEAGLGVAYHAKEVVRKSVAQSISHNDLTALLYLQGYRKEEFVS